MVWIPSELFCVNNLEIFMTWKSLISADELQTMLACKQQLTILHITIISHVLITSREK